MSLHIQRQQMAERQIIGRLGSAEEIAGTILFLASSRATFSTPLRGRAVSRRSGRWAALDELSKARIGAMPRRLKLGPRRPHGSRDAKGGQPNERVRRPRTERRGLMIDGERRRYHFEEDQWSDTDCS